jgi:hypothetical protein
MTESVMNKMLPRMSVIKIGRSGNITEVLDNFFLTFLIQMLSQPRIKEQHRNIQENKIESSQIVKVFQPFNPYVPSEIFPSLCSTYRLRDCDKFCNSSDEDIEVPDSKNNQGKKKITPALLLI